MRATGTICFRRWRCPSDAAEAVNSTAARQPWAVRLPWLPVTIPRLIKINDILDEKVRPALWVDGGYLEVLDSRTTRLVSATRSLW